MWHPGTNRVGSQACFGQTIPWLVHVRQRPDPTYPTWGDASRRKPGAVRMKAGGPRNAFLEEIQPQMDSGRLHSTAVPVEYLNRPKIGSGYHANRGPGVTALLHENVTIGVGSWPGPPGWHGSHPV